MTIKKKMLIQPMLNSLSEKEITMVKKEFGLTKTELTYLLTLSKRYRKNTKEILKKLTVQ